MRFRCHSNGAVRFGFKEPGIVQCGSLRLLDNLNLTVRFGAVIRPTVQLGAGLKISSPTVRFCAVIKNQKSHGVVRFCNVLFKNVWGISPFDHSQKVIQYLM